MTKSIFGKLCFDYYEADLIVTPLNGKRPFIKGWQKPDQYDEAFYEAASEKFPNCGIGLLLGECTGIVAVDIDKDQALDWCPKSPCVKKGKKGETRFFRFNGETNVKKHDLGIEILSSGNQTVLPPSIHPETNEAYVWTTPDLLSMYDELPLLDPDFYRRISVYKGANETSGRHSKLVEICGAIIEAQTPFDEAIQQLVDYDNRNHEPSYFTDKSEPHKGAGIVAALNLYTSLMNTVHSKGKYSPPLYVKNEIDIELLLDTKKKKRIMLPEPRGHLKNLQNHVLANSPKKRRAFALASAHATIGTFLANKIRFGNVTTNLYQLMVTESGEGKDTPLKIPIECFDNAGKLNYAGLENYTTLPAYLQEFKINRERLDVIDEASKIFTLLSETKGFTVGLAETITQTWSCTGSLFRGQKTKTDGISGICHSPAVSILAGTTPLAFGNSFSSEYFGQGFGARFMYIYEPNRKHGKLILTRHDLDALTKSFLRHWGAVEVQTVDHDISSMGAKVTSTDEKGKVILIDLQTVDRPVIHDVKEFTSPEVLSYIDEMFYFFDKLAYKENDRNIRALYHRAYQNVIKIALISAASQLKPGDADVRLSKFDIEYATSFVLYSVQSARDLLDGYLYESEWQRIVNDVLSRAKAVTDTEGCFTKTLLRRGFTKYPSQTFEKALQSLLDTSKIILLGEFSTINSYGAKFKVL